MDTARRLASDPLTRLNLVNILMAAGAGCTPLWGCLMQPDDHTRLLSIAAGLLMAAWTMLGNVLRRLTTDDSRLTDMTRQMPGPAAC